MLKTKVVCPSCGFFLFNIVGADAMKTIGSIEDVTCPNRRCRAKTSVVVGACEEVEKENTVENELRKDIENG